METKLSKTDREIIIELFHLTNMMIFILLLPENCKKNQIHECDIISSNLKDKVKEWQKL